MLLHSVTVLQVFECIYAPVVEHIQVDTGSVIRSIAQVRCYLGRRREPFNA